MDITKEDIQSFDVYGLIKQVKELKKKMMPFSMLLEDGSTYFRFSE